jgi:beta-lactamase class A
MKLTTPRAGGAGSLRAAGQLAIFGACAAWAAAAQAPDALQKEIGRVSAVAGGLVGAAAIHVESGRAASWNGGLRFPMASTFKVAVALQLLHRVDDEQVRLDQMVELKPVDLHPGSGTLTSLLNKPGIVLSVQNLMDLMLLVSDNSATDVLLRLAGGAEAVTERLRTLGLEGIDVSRSTAQFIEDLRADPRRFLSDPRDTATPDGMARLLARLWKKELLKPATTGLLLDAMKRCQTGESRIKGLLPEGTEVFHKTGSGGVATNDVGIMTLPDGSHVAIAVFVKGSDRPEAARERGIAEVARTAYDFFLFR